MIARLDQFVSDVGAALDEGDQESDTIRKVSTLMGNLVAHDDWLPVRFATPHPKFYQQYLLHSDPQSRFSVVSFVWGPGQQTPIHDHTVWGVIGVLRGTEVAQSYARGATGMIPNGPPVTLRGGDVACVSPSLGDIHRVANGHSDRVSISIHVYGTDIGQRRRHVFDPDTGIEKDFVSGYADVPKEHA